ncbi:MAG: HAD family hydrolase [Candidatus Omnitrophota bacterium]|nr:HAD family hydrolase [Candidatus Omnitrophota bacterium]
MVKLLIFDIDGTIVDAYGAIEKSLNYTLRQLGYTRVSASRARRAVGFGDKNFIAGFVRHKDVETALAIYREHHKAALLKYSRVIPGARMTLKRLKTRKYKLAVATNRPGKFSMILLRHLGLKKYFDVIVCAKNRDEIKPKPRLLLNIIGKLKIHKGEALYVGDMAIDVMAGRNAGIKTIAISGGSSYRYELKKARPFRIISKLPDLLKILGLGLKTSALS